MNTLRYQRPRNTIGRWQGETGGIITQPDSILQTLQELNSGCVLLDYQDQIAVTKNGRLIKGDDSQSGVTAVAEISPIQPENFGNPGFLSRYGIQRAYMAGSMANGISGTDFVITLGRAGYLASYGAGGVSPERLLDAVETIQEALPEGPYCFNLIHSPQEAALEQSAVDIYLERHVQIIEASAYLRLTPPVVQYRAAGLQEDPSGKIQVNNRIIAKLSRPEVALQFLNPAPEKILQELVRSDKISPRQAELAGQVPMADDITVEADSGGHTDNRPLVGLLPSITALRDEIQREHNYAVPVQIGAGGGIGTPASVLGAFAMGAAYVVTGSINQACLEADTSPGVKQALAQAGAPDVMMAPSADMFEMGVKVQVLKRGTMFPMRSQKLYDVYREYESIESIPSDLRADLESKIFQKNLDAVWTECVRFFEVRDPEQLEKARANPKKKMALVFRWYLGLATHWGIQGLPERQLDYQVWCGPAMGAFNDWARGTELDKAGNRSAVRVADQLLMEAAYLYRLNQLGLQGISAPVSWRRFLG
jgi:PfaD family protein